MWRRFTSGRGTEGVLSALGTALLERRCEVCFVAGAALTPLEAQVRRRRGRCFGRGGGLWGRARAFSYSLKPASIRVG